MSILPGTSNAKGLFVHICHTRRPEGLLRILSQSEYITTTSSIYFSAMSKQKEAIPTLVACNLDALGRLYALLESQDQPSQSLGQSYLARFKLWAGTLGAHRASGTRSLEYRLRDASSIREHLLSLLQELKDMVVNEGKYLTLQSRLRQWSGLLTLFSTTILAIW